MSRDSALTEQEQAQLNEMLCRAPTHYWDGVEYVFGFANGVYRAAAGEQVCGRYLRRIREVLSAEASNV